MTAAVLLLSGCANPFATHANEYGRIADEASLHTAGTLDLEAGAVDTPASADRLPLEVPPNPFEGVGHFPVIVYPSRSFFPYPLDLVRSDNLIFILVANTKKYDLFGNRRVR